MWNIRAVLSLTLLVAAGCGSKNDAFHLDFTRDFAAGDLEFEISRMDLGTDSSWTHLGRGWSIPKSSREGFTFVWAMGPESEVQFFLSQPRRLTLRLFGRPFVYPGSPQQQVEAVLNGISVGSAEVAKKRSWAEIVLPSQAMRRGVNRLVLRPGYNQRPCDVRDSTDVRSLSAAWEVLELVGCRQDTPPHRNPNADDEVVLPSGTAVAAYLPAGDQRRLQVDRIAGSEGSLCVSWEVDGEAMKDLGCRRSDGRAVSIRLPDSPDQPARLRLRSSENGGELTLFRARVVGPTTDGGTQVPVQRPAASTFYPNVVLYSVDTLRSDRLGCYGHDRPTSPRLDEFTRSAVVFENAFAQSSWTKPTVTSLLSGLGSLEHGVYKRDHAVRDDLPWLPEILKRAGYRTGAFSTNAYLTEVGGYSRGFDAFEFRSDSAREMTRSAIDWLQSATGDSPFLLWVHTVDPHGPYEPRQPFRGQFAPEIDDPRMGSIECLQALGSAEFPRNEKTYRDLLSLYDAEIAQNDEAFGELLDALGTQDLLHDTLVVFVSDHGEAFGERGAVGHGRDLYHETVKVPLVIRPPGGVTGSRVGELVQQIDLVPTILDLLGIPAPPNLSGRSMRPLWNGDHVWPGRPAVAYLNADQRHGVAVRLRRWKAIEPFSAGFSGGRELFDLENDPDESNNLCGVRPVLAGWLVSIGRRAIQSAPEPVPLETSPSQKEKDALEALGYVQ